MVCADVRREGYRAFLTSQDCPYDVVIDSRPDLWRVQVKTTARGKEGHTDMPVWNFNLRRIRNQKHKPYDDNDYDLLALVAVDIQKIAYVLPVKGESIRVRSEDFGPSDFRGPWGIYFEDFPLGRTLDLLRNGGGDFSRREYCREITVCQRGHKMTEENTYITPGNGQRSCRECRNLRARNFRSRQK